MNLAILIPEMGGGGAERIAKIVGDYYVRKGDNVFYFLGDFGIKPVHKVKGRIIQTHITPLSPFENMGFCIWLMALYSRVVRMRQLKKKYHIDCSISFMEEFNWLNVLSRCGDRVIIRICTILSERSELIGYLYKKSFLHIVYSFADYLVVMSRDGLQEMRDVYGIAEKKIHIIPNPCDEGDNRVFNGADYPQWRYGERAVISVARLEPVKGHHRMINVFRKVAKEDSKAKLVFLGQGTLETYLKGICRRYGLEDRVVFLGYTKDVPYYLMNARVFIMASKCEGFPNAAVEAMLCGCPVAAIDSPGGLRDILEGTEQDKSISEDTISCNLIHSPEVRILPYGVLISHDEKQDSDNDEFQEKEDDALAQAILAILQDNSFYEELRRRSFLRATHYKYDCVMSLWDKIVC